MTFHFPKAIPLVLAAGAALSAAALSGQGEAHETGAHPAPGLTCAIVTRDLGGMVEISGVVRSDRDTSGAYELKIRQASGAGHATIDQAGEFSAPPGRNVTLGEATLGGTPGSYEADLTLTVNGQRLRCLGADDRTDI